MYFKWFSQQTAIVSLHSRDILFGTISWLRAEMQGVKKISF